MTPVGEVSFELERFEWTADDRLEVVGRWNGVRGRRIARPALTVDTGDRRQRVSGSQISDNGPDEPWRASFDWDPSRGDPTGAELEIGRSLVVELPAPRRRRRRSAVGAENDLRAQVDELRGMVAELRGERAAAHADATDAHELRSSVEAERDRLAAELEAARGEGADAERLAAVEAERDRLAAELEGARPIPRGWRPSRPSASGSRPRWPSPTPSAIAARRRARGACASAGDSADVAANQELAGLRLAHGSLRAAHEALEDELEALRSVREERDEFAGQLEQMRAAAEDEEREKSEARRADPRAAGARQRSGPPDGRARDHPRGARRAQAPRLPAGEGARVGGRGGREAPRGRARDDDRGALAARGRA